MATQPELRDFAGLPRMGLMDLFKSMVSGTSGRDVGRIREERENFAQNMRRKKALQEAIADPTLKLTAEERALTEADIARQRNEQAAREEMASDRALVEAGLPPFAVTRDPFTGRPRPQGVMDLENRLDVTRQPPPAPAPSPAPITEEQRKFRESFVLPAPTNTPATPAPQVSTSPSIQPEAPKTRAPIETAIPDYIRPDAESSPQQESSILGRFGRGILDYLSDPVNRKSLAIGFNAMTLNPDRGFQAAMQSQIENIQEQRAITASGNATADYLDGLGLTQQAALVRQNPELAADVLKSATSRDTAYEKAAGQKRVDDEYQIVSEAEAAEFSIRKNEDLLAQVRDADSNYVGRLSSLKTETAAILGDVPGLGDALKSAELTKEWMAKAENTEALNKALQSDVFAAIRDLGIGARGLDTPAERRFLVAVIAGDVTAQRAALEELLVSKIERSRNSVKQYNRRLGAGELDDYQRVMKRTLNPINIEDQQQTIEGVSDEELFAAIARNQGGA